MRSVRLCATAAVCLPLLLSPGEAAALSSMTAGVFDFEGARQDGDGISFDGGRARPLGPGDVLNDWDGPVGGGALRLSDVGAGFGTVRGQALSTRDLAWPYGFIIELDAQAQGVSAAWAAGGADWSVSALDARGEVLADAVIAAGAEGFDLSMDPDAAPGAGFASLIFQSLDGYDWIFLDSLVTRAAGPAPSSRTFVKTAPSSPQPAAVPLPGAIALLLAGVAALAARARWGKAGV